LARATSSPPKKRTRVPRAVREEQMLDAATRIFAARGFRDAAMDEIAEACGITKPMLYAYFDSKEGLFTAAAERASETLRASVRAASEAQSTPELRLWHGLLAVFEFVEENRESWSVLYPYGPTSSGPFAEAAARARDAMSELLTELFAETAAGEGVSRDPARDSEPLAHALTGATIALASWSAAHPEESVRMHALRLMNFAWMGLGNLARGKLWVPPGEARKRRR
jgi:AcrR family transcriptional regulator